MIHDVDEALRLVVRKHAVRGTGDVEISFEAPSTDWASRRSGPAVNLYLYDIREDLARRTTMYDRISDPTDPRITAARRPPARFFKLSYLLTAWTQRPEDEHRLLSACLGSFLRYDLIPEDCLTGALVDVPGRCLVQVAQPPAGDRSISDIWTALGGELKPSLDVRVTAPFPVEREDVVGPPVREEATLEVRTSDGLVHERPMRQRRGRAGGEGLIDEDGAWRALGDEVLHGEGVNRPAAIEGDEDAATEGAAAAAVIGPEGGRWFRVREQPRPARPTP